jgi:1,2-diacylglycerol 3-alpha-glucosyltransferase
MVLLTDTFYPAHNGVVHSVVGHANGLVALGHQVLVVAPGHPRSKDGEWLFDRRVKVFLGVSIPFPVYPDFRLLLPSPGLFRTLKAFKPDILHAHGPLSADWIGWVYGKLHKLPATITYNTNLDSSNVLELFPKWSRWGLRVLQKVGIWISMEFYKWHDGVMVPTVSAATKLAHWGVEASVIHSPVPVEQFAGGQEAGRLLRKALKLDGVPVVLFIGRLSPEKEVERLIETFSLLLDKIPTAKLLLVGDGPSRESLQRQVERLHITENVQMVGALPYRQLIDQGWFFVGDVFVTMSEFETQGMSTVEAMACGLPVVAVACEANIDVVKGVGKLVESKPLEKVAEVVSEVLQNKALARKLKANSLAAAWEYSWNVCAERLVEFSLARAPHLKR